MKKTALVCEAQVPRVHGGAERHVRALMKERTLRGTVNKSWLEGGEMPSARLPNGGGFISGGEVILLADVLSTT